MRPLAVTDRVRFKVPHIGWNTARTVTASPLTRGLGPEAAFFFTHSYTFDAPDDGLVLQTTAYSSTFASAFGRGNI